MRLVNILYKTLIISFFNAVLLGQILPGEKLGNSCTYRIGYTIYKVSHDPKLLTNHVANLDGQLFTKYSHWLHAVD